MEAIFLKIINMSLISSFLILAVILLRLLLKKAPKWLNCVMWGLVAIRLVLPISLESIFSLIPSSEPLPSDIITTANPQIQSGMNIIDSTVNPMLSTSMTPNAGDSVNPTQVWSAILTLTWILGIVSLAVFELVSFLRIQRKVRASLKLRDNIYICDDIQTPFLLGIFKPRIYIPSGTDEAQLNHIIAHENAHLKRLDYLWKPLGYLVLMLHWFNPLVWIAYILLCRDIEFACDEKVIKELDRAESIAYTEALLSCSVNRKTILVCPLAFGEVGVKERVKRVLSYKKPAFWIIVAAVLLSVIAAVCFMTNPLNEKPTFTAVMESENSDMPSVTVEGYLNGPSLKDIYLVIDGLRYNVLSGPTVNSPEYELKAETSDGLGYMKLKFNTVESEMNAVLYKISLEGTENIYVCDIREFEDLLTWGNSGMPVELPEKEKALLTLDDVLRLSEKGESLTWEDFAPYKSIATGSGLYILAYEIDETFVLYVGGTSQVGKPMYVYLRLKGNYDTQINLLESDTAAVKDFIDLHDRFNSNEGNADEPTELLLTAKEITEDQIVAYAFVDDVTEQTRYIAIEANKKIKNVRILSMSLGESKMEFDRVLHTIPDYSVTYPFHIGIVFYGDLTTYGLLFTDQSGTEYAYQIYESGKDGSVVLQPMNASNIKINPIKSIIDRTVIESLVTADALEPFYSDENYIYSFPSIRSEYVIVTFTDGSTKGVKEALADGDISITDLAAFGIYYYSEPKSK